MRIHQSARLFEFQFLQSGQQFVAQFIPCPPKLVVERRRVVFSGEFLFTLGRRSRHIVFHRTVVQQLRRQRQLRHRCPELRIVRELLFSLPPCRSLLFHGCMSIPLSGGILRCGRGDTERVRIHWYDHVHKFCFLRGGHRALLCSLKLRPERCALLHSAAASSPLRGGRGQLHVRIGLPTGTVRRACPAFHTTAFIVQPLIRYTMVAGFFLRGRPFVRLRSPRWPQFPSSPMRIRSTITILSAASILLLSACSRSTESTMEQQIDLNDDGSMHVETNEGTYDAGSNRLPDDWPTDAPIFAGATVQYSGAANPTTGKAGAAAVLMTTHSPSEVLDFYTAELKKQGWTVTSTMEAQGTTILGATKGSRALSLMVGSVESQTSITIGVGEQ